MIRLCEMRLDIDAPGGPLAFVTGAYRVPDGAVFAHGDIALPEALRRAVPKRQIEFLAGRTCAARALGLLGLAPAPLPVGKRGAPLWPGDVVGSISHSQGMVVCMAGLRPGYLGLGIDIEHVVSSDDATALAPDIATEREFALLAPFHERRMAFTVLFSAKEAVYKAIHSRVRRVVEFNEVTCTEASASTLSFRLRPELAGETGLSGEVGVVVKTSEDHCVTQCRL